MRLRLPLQGCLARVVPLRVFVGKNKTMFDYHKEFATMAAVCDVCAKGPGFGKSVSHSHRRTNRRWNPNIQPVRAQVAPGNTKKLNVCTSCLKAGKVVRG